MNTEVSLEKITEVLGSSIVRSTLEKVAQIELQRCRLKMDKVSADLVPFERRFGKDSLTAWTDFQNGKSGDDSDIMEWMMIFQNYIALEKQCNQFLGIGIE